MRPLTHTYGPEKAQDTLLVIHQREDVPEESHQLVERMVLAEWIWSGCRSLRVA